MLSAGTVYIGTTVFALCVSQFAAINVVLVLAWLAVAVVTGSSSGAGRRRKAGAQHVTSAARRHRQRRRAAGRD